MKLRIEGGIAKVTLSKRNLLSLLTKLDHPLSARTILSYNCEPNGMVLIVTSEPDDDHYGEREFGPGPMHPITEREIVERMAA